MAWEEGSAQRGGLRVPRGSRGRGLPRGGGSRGRVCLEGVALGEGSA